jgi:hypothetical protein
MDALGDAQLLRLIAQGGLIRAFPGQREMGLRDLRQSRKRQRLTLDGDQRAGGYEKRRAFGQGDLAERGASLRAGSL